MRNKMILDLSDKSLESIVDIIEAFHEKIAGYVIPTEFYEELDGLVRTKKCFTVSDQSDNRKTFFTIKGSDLLTDCVSTEGSHFTDKIALKANYRDAVSNNCKFICSLAEFKLLYLDGDVNLSNLIVRDNNVPQVAIEKNVFAVIFDFENIAETLDKVEIINNIQNAS